MEYVKAPRAPQRAVRQPDRQAPQRGGTGRGRRRRRASRLLLLIGLLLAAAAAAVAAYVLLFAERERTVSMTATPLTAGVTRLNTGSGLLYQTEGHIHYYDWNDQGRNYTEGTATEDIRMSGSTFLSVVYTPTMLQIVGQEQPVAFTGEVLSVECGREHIAVLRRDSEGGESILVLSATGEQVDQLLPDDQYIVDFGFYTTTGEMLWMQTISSASGTPTTRITTYDLQRRTGVGVMQVQDQLIDGLYFTENSVFAAGTSQIIRYTHDGNKEIYREMVYGYRVLDFSAASGTPTFLLAPRDGDMYAVKLLTLSEGDTPEAVETHLQLPSEGVAGYIMNGALVVVAREKLYTYSLRGSLSSTATLELPVDEAEKLSDTMLLLLSGGAYYTAKVR